MITNDVPGATEKRWYDGTFELLKLGYYEKDNIRMDRASRTAIGLLAMTERIALDAMRKAYFNGLAEGLVFDDEEKDNLLEGLYKSTAHARPSDLERKDCTPEQYSQVSRAGFDSDIIAGKEYINKWSMYNDFSFWNQPIMSREEVFRKHQQ